MPQVKIKQGTKSFINNNTGVLNAGTLAVTTDTNELFFTHNDGTLHQLCDNVNKSGDTMTGNLNMSGNSFERAGFEVVTSLPATNNFVGRQVTYQGRNYIWDGSAWVNVADGGNADKLDNYHLDDIKKYIASRGENLITNGSALMGNNLNFSQFTFDGSQAYYSNGSFRYKRPENGGELAVNNELMPVNPNIKYKLDFFAKSLSNTGRYYALIDCFDVDGLQINSHCHMYLPNTLTTLAQPLNNGDTIVYLTSAANWDNTGINGISSKSFIFWNYVNSFGYLYPPLTYSRNASNGDMWANGSVNTSNNTITLKNPWSGGTVAAGTQLSNGNYGGTYKYLALGYTQLPTTWTNYNGIMNGVDLSGQNLSNKFPPGTAKVKLGFLMDYNNVGDTAWFTNLSFAIDTDVNLTLNFDTNNIEPTQTGTVTKTSTWTWQYLVQSMNYSWLKLKTWVGGLFSAGSATTNNNYLPKINDVDKKLVKSNIYDDGTTPKYGANTIWHSGNDGSGSGLDADLLDGQQGSYYLDWTNTTNKPDPTLTLTGDVTGSGTMTDLGNVSITTTVTDDSHNHSDTTITSLSGSKINSGTIGFSYLPTGTSGSTVAIGNHNHSGVYQPIDADLTAIAALSGTSGLLKKTAADTWSLDTTAYTTNTGTVTNIVTGNGLSGGPITTTGTINLATAYGDTVNPYASKTAKYVLAAPNAGDGVPTFRLLVASDIPTLNQNTTGSAGSVTSSITFNNGGAGDASETTYNGSTARTISYNTIGAAASSHTHSTYVNQTLTSGNGMAAWTATNGDLTVALGTPSPITGSSINEVTTTSHTHAISITPTDIGAATSAQGTKADSALQAIDKAMVENVLTGVITSHSHSGNDSGNDTKNTAGATDTSSKIYLVGSTDQTANPQTYTHDTAYVDVDGSVYSGSSKTITVSDLVTNQIVTPTLNPTWTIRNYVGTAVSSPTNPSGEAISGTSIILEYGFKPSMTVKGKWIAQAGYDNPTSCSGLCGTSLPASNVETASTASIDLYNSATYSSTTVPATTSDYWTIFTPKKGITISGSSLVLPIGNISASARVQVTYQLPIYYGNITSLTIIEADVKALTTKIWKNYQAISKSISPIINSTDSQYWIYAYPAAWGSLTTISNADGDWIAAFTSSTVNITGAPGLPVLYKYYITVNKGAFKSKTINFS